MGYIHDTSILLPDKQDFTFIYFGEESHRLDESVCAIIGESWESPLDFRGFFHSR